MTLGAGGALRVNDGPGSLRKDWIPPWVERRTGTSDAGPS
jgi:hypothetical protein